LIEVTSAATSRLPLPLFWFLFLFEGWWVCDHW